MLLFLNCFTLPQAQVFVIFPYIKVKSINHKITLFMTNLVKD